MARSGPSSSDRARSGLDLRPGGCYRLAGLVRELLEVVAEHASELAGLAVVRVSVAPRRPGVEQPRVDLGHLDRNLEAEDRVLAVLDAVELARQGGAQHRARCLDRHPAALAERPAGPPRV